MDAITGAIQGRKDRRMSDLIDRQAAIDAMEQAKEQYFDRRVIIEKCKMLLAICHPHSQGSLGARIASIK